MGGLIVQAARWIAIAAAGYFASEAIEDVTNVVAVDTDPQTGQLRPSPNMRWIVVGTTAVVGLVVFAVIKTKK